MKPVYIQNFISNYSANILLSSLLRLDWLKVKDARFEYFMSDVPRTYVYDKSGFEYQSQTFDPDVQAIMDRLNGKHHSISLRKLSYNVCFLNRYDNQHQALGWHADDSPNVDPNHPIAVISLGAEREIWWKPIGFKGEIPEENRQILHNGSLFIMPPHFQQNFLHKIPKHDRACGTRISLTFRKYI